MTTMLRAGLVLLAAVEWVLGLWTAFLPRSFYEDVPTVDLTPPFSEHLMRDVGGATLGLAIALTAAAIWLERRLVVVALLAYLAFALPHLVFHVAHLEHATPLEATVLVALQAGAVVLPLALLAITRRAGLPRAPGSPPASGSPGPASPAAGRRTSSPSPR
ncbi:hypothetical protein [Blastococcus sp. PRF04-17]|uniref:hypothetical protein n=1 Tax=Blastococcus sp. PRF04-17 TaxID=2933797 RepID=UPI001FF5F556|nr:hypothetical protein [Blastococcus sp. PRF04-17]UOY00420.1 hypothetical protein MVA48_15620 [Blastococcus sp. PRF04-17]